MKIRILFFALACFKGSLFFSQSPVTVIDSSNIPSKSWALGINPLSLFADAQFELSDVTQSIGGRYFVNPHQALRFGLSLGFNRRMHQMDCLDRAAAANTVVSFPSPAVQTENTWAKQTLMLGGSFGKEYRSHNSKIQGIWGWETAFRWSKQSDRFTYGNALNASAAAPVYVDTTGDAMRTPVWGEAFNVSVQNIQGVNGYARLLERQSGGQWMLGGRLFAGMEYFIKPALSLGAELGWGAMLVWQNRGSGKWESIGQSNTQGSSELRVGTSLLEEEGYLDLRANTLGSFNTQGFNGILRLTVYFNRF